MAIIDGPIILGKKYKDKITGFEGVATGFVQYISGCNQALLAPIATEINRLPDSSWLDVQRLEPVGKEMIVLDNSATPGCDRAAPIR
ncbi:MAG: hypothetical protein A2Z99_05465 [Treponema sp. GWB1_62_6]|nr:MAG: hypothetical protein A2Z99_05465 [Treponema sp. GWB1_62_6]